MLFRYFIHLTCFFIHLFQIFIQHILYIGSILVNSILIQNISNCGPSKPFLISYLSYIHSLSKMKKAMAILHNPIIYFPLDAVSHIYTLPSPETAIISLYVPLLLFLSTSHPPAFYPPPLSYHMSSLSCSISLPYVIDTYIL